MFMDPGRFGAPSIQLAFRFQHQDEDYCKNSWDVDSHIGCEWAMNDLTVRHVLDQANDIDCHDSLVISACEESERKNLISITFKSWGQVVGYGRALENDDRRTSKKSRNSMYTIFAGKRPYRLKVWFKAPYGVPWFQQTCLAHFTKAMAARLPPLHNFTDDQGKRFVGKEKFGSRTESKSADSKALPDRTSTRDKAQGSFGSIEE